MEYDRAFWLVLALTLATIVGFWGSTRKIGFWFAFILAVFNLFIGIIAVACSKKEKNKEEHSEEDNKL